MTLRAELLAKAAEVHDLLALERNPKRRRTLHDLFVDDLYDLETRDSEFGEGATRLAEAFAGAVGRWVEREAHSVRVDETPQLVGVLRTVEAQRPDLTLVKGGDE